MRLAFVLNCWGAGDVIALSSVARSLQVAGHESLLATGAVSCVMETAAHVEGFDRTAFYCVRPESLDSVRSVFPDHKAVVVDYSVERPNRNRVSSFLATTGLDVPLIGPKWVVQPYEQEAALHILKESPCNGRPLVCIAPVSSKVQRRFDPATFAGIHDMLWDRGFGVVTFSGSTDYFASAGCRRPLVSLGNYGVGLTAAVLSNCLAVVGVDTFPIHVGAALGIPVLGAFGPFGFDRVCGTYQNCHELYYRKRLSCYDCVLGDQPVPAQLKASCGMSGCSQINQVEPVRAVAMVEKLCASKAPRSQSTKVRVNVRSRSVLRGLYSTDCVAVTAGTGRFKQLAGMCARRVETVGGLRCLDLSEHAPWKSVPHPSWIKAYLWDLVPEDVSRLIWIDADMFVLQQLPSVPRGQFAAVLDKSNTLARDRQRLACLPADTEYFNAGLFVADRSTRPIFEELKQLMHGSDQGRFWEQSWLNILVPKKLGGYTKVDKAWNWGLNTRPPRHVLLSHVDSGVKKIQMEVLQKLYGLAGTDRPLGVGDVTAVYDATKEHT